MLQIFWIVFGVLIQFIGLSLFISYKKYAFIQMRMPTLTVLIVFLSLLLGILDQFIRFDNSTDKMYLGCATYALTYGSLPVWLSIIFTIMNSKLYVKGSFGETKQSRKLLDICINLSGFTDDVNNWQNLEYLKKLKFQKNFLISLFAFFPLFLNYANYYIVMKSLKKDILGYGMDQCIPIANLISIIFFVCSCVFNIVLLVDLKGKNDIFFVKKTMMLCLVGFVLYGSVLLTDIIYATITGNFYVNYIVMSIILTISNFPFTYLPIILHYSRYKHSKIAIHDVYRKAEYLQNFIKICEASYCISYVMFIEDYKKLNSSKPLEVQRLSKKYFNPRSPLYLKLIVGNTN